VGRLLLVCLGGALGSGARYLVGGYLAGWEGSELPYGTLAIHETGSLFVAVVMTLALEARVLSAELRPFLATGVMGGRVTCSAFNYEALTLTGRRPRAAPPAYPALTLVGCLIAGFAGIVAVQALASGTKGAMRP